MRERVRAARTEDELVDSLLTMVDNIREGERERSAAKVERAREQRDKAVEALRHERPEAANGQVFRAVMGGLKACINDHGPITSEWTTSATKRILATLAERGIISEAERYPQWVSTR